MATVCPHPDFDGNNELISNMAEELKNAIHGGGTDEETILRILVSLNNEQRRVLADAYMQAYGETLINDIKGDESGCFEAFLVALLKSPREFDADELEKAIKGPGTDERPLIEIFTTRSNEELDEIKEIYQEKFGETLDEALSCDTGGSFGRLMKSLVNARREDDEIDYDRAHDDAQKLYDAGIGQWGTDECDINAILCLRSQAQLREMFTIYEKEIRNGEHTIEEDLDSETSGDHQAGLIAIVQVAKDKDAYFADMLRRSMKGMGTWDNDLIRIIVSRSEVDLQCIKDKFAELGYGDLFEWVKDDTDGYYQRGLLSLLQGMYVPPF